MTLRHRLTLLLITALSFTVHATGKSGRISHLDTSSGLSSGYVTAIAQDGDGYIWLATEDGLNRFDGRRFIVYNRNNSGLTANELNALAYSPAHPGKLYIATQRDGICVYDGKSGEIRPLTHPDPVPEAVTSIIPASDGGLWLSHYHFGVEHFNPDNGESTFYGFETIKGLPHKAWTMAEGDSGRLYIGHCQDGFSVVDTLAKTFVNYRHIPGQPSLPGNEVYCICIDPSGYVWLGTDAGAALFNPNTGAIVPFVHDGPGSIGAGRIKSIIHLDSGEMLFATSKGGVSILDLKSYAYSDISKAVFRSLPVTGGHNGTSGVYSQCIFPDRYGNIWIGNYRNGADVISHVNPVFSILDYREGSIGAPVFKPAWGCVKGRDGDIWFGGENEIVRFNSGKVTVYGLPQDDSGNRTFVNSMAVDSEGNVWVGTNERGAFIFDTSSLSFRSVAGSPRNVRGFLSRKNGEMWLCTSEGLFFYSGGKAFYHDQINPRLPDHVVECAMEDKDGNLWIGTFGQGLTVISSDLKRQTHISARDGFPSNAINTIKSDSHSRMWVATRNGAAVFPDIRHPETFNKISRLDSLGITYVKAIEEAPDSCIWMTTNKGIVRISGNGDVSLYKPSPGLPLNSFIGNGSVADSDGKIFFTSVNGIFRVDTENAGSTPSETHIPLGISNFTIFREGRDSHDNEYSIPITSKKLSLHYDQNTFKITFCILDHALNDHYDLSYNMKGLDNVWMETHEDNYAMYSDLPPGKYKFQIRVRQKGHDWGNPETVLEIEIAPPVWASWWAMTAYALVFLTVTVIIMLYYKKRVGIKQRLEAELENNRNKQKLNEERLRFYTNITHELRTPLTLILGPLEDMVSDPGLPGKYSTKLQMIRDSSNTLLNLINGILEFRKTETQNRRLTVKKGNLGNLLREIGLRYKELNRNPDVEICLDIENDSRSMYFDSEIITTIVNNLLSNAVKYTPEGMIKLSYHTSAENGTVYSVISVSDTDYGISKEGLSHIFERYYQESGAHQASGTGIGLSLVKSLADIHQATIEADSKENVGSVFTLKLLADAVYPDALHRDTNETAPLPKEIPADDPEPARTEKCHILIVEDNHDIREYIAQALSPDFTVSTARNGLEGLKAVHSENPDLVISDIMMPEMDGIDLCRTLKEDILTSHIPVILLTAKDSIDDRELGYESGADSYLTKPFSARLLLTRIHNLMRRRRQIAATIMENLKEKPLENHYDASSQTPAGASGDADGGSSITKEIELSDLDREFIEKFTSTIRENIAVKNLGVSFLADKMCMSLSTLYRKVTSLLGVSTADYIRKVRLSAAAELLLKGDRSVMEIADATGFSGHSTLARAFKREYGMTATEYTAKARGASPSLLETSQSDKS